MATSQLRRSCNTSTQGNSAACGDLDSGVMPRLQRVNRRGAAPRFPVYTVPRANPAPRHCPGTAFRGSRCVGLRSPADETGAGAGGPMTSPGRGGKRGRESTAVAAVPVPYGRLEAIPPLPLPPRFPRSRAGGAKGIPELFLPLGSSRGRGPRCTQRCGGKPGCPHGPGRSPQASAAPRVASIAGRRALSSGTAGLAALPQLPARLPISIPFSIPIPIPFPQPLPAQLPPAAAPGPSGWGPVEGTHSPPRGVGAGRQGEQEEDEGEAKPRGRARRPREGSALRTPGGQGNPRRRFQAVWAEHISPGRGPDGEMTREGGPARAPLGGTARHGPAARRPAPRC